MAPSGLLQIKQAARRKAAAPSAVMVQKQMIATVEPTTGRSVRFTISTAAVDRDNDTIAVNGWQLDNFRRNPVVLWMHDYCHLPIGRCTEIAIEGDALKATVEFVSPDVPHIGEKAEAIFQLVTTGFLSATSVGFRPIEYEIAADRSDDEWWPGLDFTSQELMEFSIVTVPCNPEALIEVEPQLITVDPAQELASEPPSQKSEEEIAEEVRIAEIRRARRERQAQARIVALS